MTVVLFLLALLGLIWVGGAVVSGRESVRDRFAARRHLRGAYVRAGRTPPSRL